MFKSVTEELEYTIKFSNGEKIVFHSLLNNLDETRKEFDRVIGAIKEEEFVFVVGKLSSSG